MRVRMANKKVNVDGLSSYVHHLFPTPVAFSNINRKFSKKELEVFKTHEEDENLKTNTGNRSSINNNVLEHEDMCDIKTYCQNFVNDYLNNIICPLHDVELYITQSWINHTKPGEFHHRHNHANSYLSGVFYISADAANDKIFFYKDGHKQIQLITKSWNDFNSDSWWFTVKTGDIVLFPSELTHMVQNVESKVPRISLAFNTFLKGYIGSNEALTGLHLGYETPMAERKYKNPPSDENDA
jgi:uncharacterized protein (TIGR02466 family)